MDTGDGSIAGSAFSTWIGAATGPAEAVNGAVSDTGAVYDTGAETVSVAECDTAATSVNGRHHLEESREVV